MRRSSTVAPRLLSGYQICRGYRAQRRPIHHSQQPYTKQAREAGEKEKKGETNPRPQIRQPSNPTHRTNLHGRAHPIDLTTKNRKALIGLQTNPRNLPNTPTRQLSTDNILMPTKLHQDISIHIQPGSHAGVIVNHDRNGTGVSYLLEEGDYRGRVHGEMVVAWCEDHGEVCAGGCGRARFGDHLVGCLAGEAEGYGRFCFCIGGLGGGEDVLDEGCFFGRG